MLHVMRRGGKLGPPLVPEQDAALRAAFGRTARLAARAGGVSIVNDHHTAGNWFACDCRGEVAARPVLVPVLGCFIRRHVTGQWPEHAPWCDFYREAAEQAAVTASYSPSAEIGLVRALASERDRPKKAVAHYGAEQRRSRLARLLFHLVDRAGLTTVAPGKGRSITQQYLALKAAAKTVMLEDKLPVASVLCTYLPAIEEFCQRVEAIPSTAFHKTGNAHGVAIGVVKSARAGVIETPLGQTIPVAGEIAIFGERDGRDDSEGMAARSPYLAALLVGRRSRASRVEVLRAYLHPCMSERWLLPVDSDLERQTMAQLMAVARWFGFRRETPVTIRKPLWDLARVAADALEGEAHEPVIPDFLVEAGEGKAARRIVVETMGYPHEAYRTRKERLRPEMERLGGGPVVVHEFHGPEDWSQTDLDRAFWFNCRSALLGGTGAGLDDGS